MPGAKRKIDEDTWLARQSKKFKCGVIIGNVYESTLAKLRLGARQFFSNVLVNTPGNSGSESENENEPRPSQIVITQQSLEAGNINTVQASTVPNTSPVSPPIRLCDSCSSQRRYQLNENNLIPVKCGFCDKPTCHLNECCECKEEFCGNCSLQKYDDGIMETFICRGCFD